MTRFARGGTANKKKPHEGSAWEDLSIKKKSGQLDSAREMKEAKKVKRPKTESITEPSENSKCDARKTQNGRVSKEMKHNLKAKKRELKNKQRLKDRQRERRRQKRKLERDMAKVCRHHGIE